MKSVYLGLLSTFLFFGCQTDISEFETELGQVAGDTMSAIDETGGSDGTLAQNFTPAHQPTWKEWFVPYAWAESCFEANTFSTCTDNSIVRTFNGCEGPLGGIRHGTVTLNWEGTSANCQLGAVGDSIIRSPDYSVVRPNANVLTVSKSGSEGQRITWVSGINNKVFTFENDGIHRVLTSENGKTLFDLTKRTDVAITVTGEDRQNRIANGGVLEVTDNIAQITCDLVPNDITWTKETCNCAVSGTWQVSCSNGKEFDLELTGCGTAKIVTPNNNKEIELDRCGLF
jgi:hypothetical protein